MPPFADKKGLRCSPRPSASSADKKVLRSSPCPSVPPSADKKGLRCSPRPSAALRVLRGQKGVKKFSVPLRAPRVLRAPPRPSDKKVLRSSPCPSVPLRGSKRCPSPPFADKSRPSATANTPRIKYPKSVTKKAPTGTPPLWTASTVKRKLLYFEPKPVPTSPGAHQCASYATTNPPAEPP